MEKIKRNSSIINEINNNPYMIKSAYLRPSTKLEENQSKKSELKLITNFSVSDENTINNDTTESQSPRISNRKSSIFNLNSFFLSRILTGKKNMENSVTYNGSNEILIDMMKKSLLNINKKTSFVEKLEGINKNQILENVMNGKFSNDQLLDLAIIILQKEFSSRTRNDITLLVKCVENIKFFKEKTTNYELLLEKCCKVMKHKFHKKDDIVYLQGAQGNLFFIILKGSVSVCKLISEDLEKKEEKITFSVFDKKTSAFKEFYLVKMLKIGDSFGGLSLTNNKLRLESIVCNEDCHFSILEKNNYDNILKEIEKEELSLEFQDFSNQKFFEQLSLNMIQKFFFHATIVDYTKNSIVYEKNNESDYFYIIKSGDFEVFLKRKKKKTNENEIILQNSNIKNNTYYSLFILTKSNFFGYEEIIFNSRRKYSIKCNSLKGSLYAIEKEIFLNLYLCENNKNFFDKKIKENNYFVKNRLKLLQNFNGKLEKTKETNENFYKNSDSDYELNEQDRELFFSYHLMKIKANKNNSKNISLEKNYNLNKNETNENSIKKLCLFNNCLNENKKIKKLQLRSLINVLPRKFSMPEKKTSKIFFQSSVANKKQIIEKSNISKIKKHESLSSIERSLSKRTENKINKSKYDKNPYGLIVNNNSKCFSDKEIKTVHSFESTKNVNNNFNYCLPLKYSASKIKETKKTQIKSKFLKIINNISKI